MKKTIAFAALLAATAFTPALAQRAPSAEGVDEAAERGRYDGPREQRQEQVRQEQVRQDTPPMMQSPRAVELPASQAAPAPQPAGGWQGRRDGMNNGGGAPTWNGPRADGNGGWARRQAEAPVAVPQQVNPVPVQQGQAQWQGRGNWQQNGQRNDSWRNNRAENSGNGNGNRPGVPPVAVAPRNDSWRNGEVRNDGWQGQVRRNDTWRNDGRNDARNDGRGYDRRYADPRNGWQVQQRWGNNQGWGGYQGYDNRAWNRDWRNDRQYDWQRYRSYNRDLYRGERYYAPYGWSYGYRRFSIGLTLSNVLFDQQYWIDDPYAYRLPPVYGAYRWVRYYDDVLLVDLRSGRVVDAIYGFFW